MFDGEDTFIINSKVSWRKDKLGKRNIILIGVPQIHSLFILEKLGSKIWMLSYENKTFDEISDNISKLIKKDSREECGYFIQKLIDKDIISKNDKKN